MRKIIIMRISSLIVTHILYNISTCFLDYYKIPSAQLNSDNNPANIFAMISAQHKGIMKNRVHGDDKDDLFFFANNPSLT